MSYVIAGPEFLTSAAHDLAGIGSELREANAAAAANIMRVVAPGVDEVSVAVATLLSSQGQSYRKISGELLAFQSRFVRTLTSSADLYQGAEAANAAATRSALGAVGAVAADPLSGPRAVNAAVRNLLGSVETAPRSSQLHWCRPGLTP
ncbi:PE family protein [Mycobacterium camsae]|uniref:PE family protein n=1 Tax=Mycobacterium gordonae TaxID=1778 RepID=UPI00197DF53B|nr:PE family protein [Mycobacterium gordonae]